MSQTQHSVIEQVEQWLNQVVIGLNLCPFAAKPAKAGQIHLAVSTATTEQQLLLELAEQIELISKSSPLDIETTLFIAANMLDDFYDYNQFLNEVDHYLVQDNWVGEFQVASFHPEYQFAGTQLTDRENYTNRSPFPIFHIIREASLERALNNYPNPEQIPENNIQRMQQLSHAQLASLFPYLLQQDE